MEIGRGLAIAVAIFGVALAGCGEQGSHAADAGPDAFVAPPGCNGSESLCDRRFDEVASLVTHNAFSAAEDRFAGPNQRYGMRRQLEDGVRGLMLDLHTWRDGKTYLCHAACELGRTLLVDGLAQIRGYLEDDPGAVVTLILESYAEPDAVVAAFDEAGLTPFAIAHTPGEPWPTLRSMIDAGTRLVVLTDDERGGAPWLLPVWRHMVDTPYAAREPSELLCEWGRGDPENALVLFNHFLTRTLGSPELAAMVNYDPFFSERVSTCAETLGRAPNFVGVDFYELGDGLAVVRALNAR